MRKRTVLLVSLGVLSITSFIAAGLYPATAEPTLSDEEQLGESIFHDTNLSIMRNQSCASCHAPEAGWAGPDPGINAHGAVYEGSIANRFGDRRPPTAAYATQAPVLHMPEEGFFVGGTFWDGRATGERLGSPTAEQALGPFLNPVEQALPDAACVVYRVVTASYPVSFESVYGPLEVDWPADVEATCEIEGGAVALTAEDRVEVMAAYDQIGLAIAAYEGSPEVNAFTSKFDAVRMKLARFSKEEKKGFNLFNGKGKCDLCHISKGPMPLFTDYTYDNLGIPSNPEDPANVADPDFTDLGLGGFLDSLGEAHPWFAYAAENSGKFKVPTLRNVDLRVSEAFVKAFGHNGYFKSLEEIVHFYNTRDVLPACEDVATPEEGVNCWPAPEYPMNVNTAELGDLHLRPAQEAAIVAFLRTLSDGYAP